MLSVENRAFRYGDGLFETLRVIKGHIPFLQEHYRRLVTGLELLQIVTPDTFSIDFFEQQILSLTGKEGCSRVRFSAYRAEGGLYLPSNNGLRYLVEAHPLQQDKYVLNSKGLSTGIFESIPLFFNVLSSLKSLNALPYVLAAKYAKQNNLDDVFLINQQKNIVEASSSNVILWDGYKLLTPPVTEGCVNGIIKSALLNFTNADNLIFEEKEISIDDLKKANAVFLTNSIQGVKWVQIFQQRNYDEKVAIEVGEVLIKLNLEAAIKI